MDNPFAGRFRTKGKEIMEANRKEFDNILVNLENVVSRFSVEQAMRFSEYVKSRRFGSGGDVEHLLYRNFRHADGLKLYKIIIDL